MRIVPRLPALVAALFLATPAAADPVVFKDMNDRVVELPKPAERVSSIVIPMASTLIALDGASRRLVGMNPVAKARMEEGILSTIFPEVAAIPDTISAANFVPNVEALAASRPDLVVQWGDRGDAIVAPIVNAGMKAMLISYGTEAYARDYMAMMATAIGRPDRVKPLVGWRADVERDIAAKAAALGAAKRPKVLYVFRLMSEIQVAGSGPVYNDWYIRLVGGDNAAAEVKGQKPVGKEQIAAWDPDIILLNNFEPKLTPEFVYADPILSLTRAAKARKVYRSPLGGFMWDPPSQESPLSWMWLANLVHPEVFRYDLRAEMRAAYRTLYNYDLTDADIDRILWLDVNRTSAGYDVFARR
jgi:iron complex transport system substrate-binding protein